MAKPPRYAILLLDTAAMAVMLGAGACSVIGFTAAAVFPEKVKAAYALADRPTVVIVDDPSGLFHDRGIMNQIAVQVGDDLVAQAVLTVTVPPGALAQLEGRVGEAYKRMPIDSVGQAIGAEQVIHINIESIVVTAVRMTLVCRVKVIDAVRSERLFPGRSPTREKPTPRSVGLVTAEMVEQKIIDMDRRARALTQQELARRMSLTVSRLFYNYEVPIRNESFRNGRS